MAANDIQEIFHPGQLVCVGNLETPSWDYVNSWEYTETGVIGRHISISRGTVAMYLRKVVEPAVWSAEERSIIMHTILVQDCVVWVYPKNLTACKTF